MLVFLRTRQTVRHPSSLHPTVNVQGSVIVPHGSIAGSVRDTSNPHARADQRQEFYLEVSLNDKRHQAQATQSYSAKPKISIKQLSVQSLKSHISSTACGGSPEKRCMASALKQPWHNTLM